MTKCDLWRKSFFDVFMIPPAVPLSEWAAQNIFLGGVATPEAGAYRPGRTPYICDVLDAISDPEVEQVAICSGVQLGKTQALLSACAYFAAHRPSTILFVEPSEDLIDDIGRDRIDTLFAASPALRGLFYDVSDRLHREKKRAEIMISEKRFPGGLLKLASAASKSDLVSRPMQVVLCDEIDIYPVRSDGNAVDLAIARASNFIGKKIVLCSTPGEAGRSEIMQRIEGTTVYDFAIPCPECKKEFVWAWEHVKFDEARPETAAMFCPFCGCQVRGPSTPPPDLLSSGRWILRSAGAARKKSFIISGLLSPWVRLDTIAAEYVQAKTARDADKMRAFMQNRLATPFDVSIFDEEIAAAAEIGEPVFEERFDISAVKFCTWGIDVQRDRIEAALWAWAPNRESWYIDHKILHGDPLLDDVWADLLAVLRAPIKNAAGKKIPLAGALIDSGDGFSSARVYGFTKRKSGAHIFACKGLGGEKTPFSAPSYRNQFKVPVYCLGVNALKRTICSRLRLPDPGPGFIHLPAFAEGEIWEQLTAEREESVVYRGRVIRRFMKTRERNEALDCAVYALAAAELFGYPRIKFDAGAAHSPAILGGDPEIEDLAAPAADAIQQGER